MPGAKPKVKGKKRKSIGGTPDDERAPAPSTAAAKGKGKSKKAMEDGDGGSEPGEAVIFMGNPCPNGTHGSAPADIV